jgi:6-phospho-beta-glucosidase
MEIQSGNMERALDVYTSYLNQRSNSYMKLEADRGSAFDDNVLPGQNPFRSATGYHRIAINVMKGLSGALPQRIVVNVPNHGAIAEIHPDDIVEVPCLVARDAVTPEACGNLPEEVCGLVLAVKAYEKSAIRAAISGSSIAAQKAMLLYPPIGEWESAEALVEEMIRQHPSLSYLRPGAPSI